MSPKLFLIHPHRMEQPDSVRTFSGSAGAPGTKVFAQQEPLDCLEMTLNLETALPAKDPGVLNLLIPATHVLCK